MSPLALNPELFKPYKGDKYISRLPFIMNESVEIQPTAHMMREAAIENDRVFIGVAGFRALDLLSIAGSLSESKEGYKQAVIFDNNEAQVKMMNGVLHLISHCKTPAQFEKEFLEVYPRMVDHVPDRSYSPSIEKKLKDNPRHPLHTRLREDANFFGVTGRQLIPDSTEKLQDYFTRNLTNLESFLQPGNYARIRDLVRSGRLQMVTCDLTDKERFALMKEDFTKHGLKLGHSYLSTAPAFLMKAKQNAYHGQRREITTTHYGSPAHTMMENLKALGDGDSRYLISMNGDKPATFNLREATAEEIEDAARYAVEDNSRRLRQNHNYTYISKSLGVGTETLEIMCENPNYLTQNFEMFQNIYPHLEEEDALIIIAKNSKGYFSKSESDALYYALNDPSHHLPKLGLREHKNPEDEGARQFSIRIPAGKIYLDKELPHKVVAHIEQGLTALRPQRGR